MSSFPPSLSRNHGNDEDAHSGNEREGDGYCDGDDVDHHHDCDHGYGGGDSSNDDSEDGHTGDDNNDNKTDDDGGGGDDVNDEEALAREVILAFMDLWAMIRQTKT